MNWHLRQHRPSHLKSFSRYVAVCREFQPDYLLVTGITPPDGDTLSDSSLNIITMNYLTDDPWNPAHYAPWFIEALKSYSVVFSPRRANLNDLEKIGCRVEYVPFAYAPKLHFPEIAPPELRSLYECDVLFYGRAIKIECPI